MVDSQRCEIPRFRGGALGSVRLCEIYLGVDQCRADVGTAKVGCDVESGVSFLEAKGKEVRRTRKGPPVIDNRDNYARLELE